MGGLAGKRAFVCASSAGLGLACATALAQAGAEVCINGRDATRLADAARRIRHAAPGAIVQVVQADLHVPAQRAVCWQDEDAPDILVLNGGGPPVEEVADYTERDWQAAFERLFQPGADLLSRALPAMQRRGWGRVVAISSVAIKAPIPGLVTSTVFRLGLAGLIAGRCTAVAGQGVTLNSILPGRILTDRQEAALEREARRHNRSRAEQLDLVRAAIPAGRLGSPGEVGALCAFLCGPDAGYITGQNILIDGGAYGATF